MRQILAFEHPQTGAQLVKGFIEPGESVRAAALRELQEESGIGDTAIAQDLGTWDSGHRGYIWSLQLCTFPRRLPETWTHRCAEDGGFEFRFFWQDVDQPPGNTWRPHYRRALEAIRERTRSYRWRG
jgi:8-oxo-dGTP pyrophosphatase MutT (NUDIX family)